MPVNRFSGHQWHESETRPVAAGTPQGFVVCPGLMVPGGAAHGWTWQQEVFRMAYEIARAREIARASLAAASDYPHRLFSNWN